MAKLTCHIIVVAVLFVSQQALAANEFAAINTNTCRVFKWRGKELTVCPTLKVLTPEESKAFGSLLDFDTRKNPR